MRRAAAALLLGLVLVAPVLAHAQRAPVPTNVDTLLYNGLRWRMIGPYRGGRATAVTGIAGQPHTFLVGTTGGGVWRSEDAGMNWRNIMDGYFGGSIGAV